MGKTKEKNDEILQDELHTEAPAEEAESAPVEADETVPMSEHQKLADELKDSKDKYLRLAAEYDNFRKRTTREKESLFGDASAATVAAFLTVYDNLERAVENPTTDEVYKKGVELTFAQFCDCLSKMNVTVISPSGEKFDPNIHNAVMHVEDEALGEGIVAEVFQKGFKLGERVIRPALVKVAN